MRKRTLGVVLLAGLAMSGAGAFTGSNAMPGDSSTIKSGYGAVTATGVTVSDTDYVFNTTNDKLDRVRFTSTTNLTDLTSHVTLTDSAAPTVVVAQMDCTNNNATAALALGVTIGATEWLIDCNFATDVALTSFNNVGLTVYSSSV